MQVAGIERSIREDAAEAEIHQEGRQVNTISSRQVEEGGSGRIGFCQTYERVRRAAETLYATLLLPTQRVQQLDIGSLRRPPRHREYLRLSG